MNKAQIKRADYSCCCLFTGDFKKDKDCSDMLPSASSMSTFINLIAWSVDKIIWWHNLINSDILLGTLMLKADCVLINAMLANLIQCSAFYTFTHHTSGVHWWLIRNVVSLSSISVWGNRNLTIDITDPWMKTKSTLCFLECGLQISHSRFTTLLFSEKELESSHRGKMRAAFPTCGLGLQAHQYSSELMWLPACPPPGSPSIICSFNFYDLILAPASICNRCCVSYRAIEKPGQDPVGRVLSYRTGR